MPPVSIQPVYAESRQGRVSGRAGFIEVRSLDLEQDLRTVSDDMMSTLDQLQKLESEKRSETPGSPRFVRLAREIERLAAVVFTQTSAQQSLAEQTHEAAQAGAEMTPIEDVAPMRDVSLILSEWRDAERRLSSTAVD